VTAARGQDRDGAKRVLEPLRQRCARLRRIWADQADAGQWVTWVQALRVHHPIRVEIVKRTKRAKGFAVSPQRWMVERTLGWLNRYRRLRKDDADRPGTSETMVRVVMIHLMVRRLARIAPY
jgi:putative transposase